MSTVLERWTTKLTGRRKLLDTAERSVRYWARRAGSVHGKAMLEEAVARRALRRKQVTEAETVVARHRTPQHVSNAGVALIAGFEGFRANVYRDAVGVATQGYGETQGVTPGKAWTRAYALSRLRTRVDKDYLPPVLEALRSAGVHPTQNMVDALTSGTYNLGGAWLGSGKTMGDAIRSRNKQRMADAFLPYDVAGGQHLAGLTRRRRAERALFLK